MKMVMTIHPSPPQLTIMLIVIVVNQQKQKQKIKINDYLYSYLRTFTNIIILDVSTNKNNDIYLCYNNVNIESRMELDSHTNMPVVGKHAYILSETGRNADVKSYNHQYEAMVIPIVNAAVQYD